MQEFRANAISKGHVSLEQSLGDFVKNGQVFRTMILVDVYVILRKLDV